MDDNKKGNTGPRPPPTPTVPPVTVFDTEEYLSSERFNAPRVSQAENAPLGVGPMVSPPPVDQTGIGGLPVPMELDQTAPNAALDDTGDDEATGSPKEELLGFVDMIYRAQAEFEEAEASKTVEFHEAQASRREEFRADQVMAWGKFLRIVDEGSIAAEGTPQHRPLKIRNVGEGLHSLPSRADVTAAVAAANAAGPDTVERKPLLSVPTTKNKQPSKQGGKSEPPISPEQPDYEMQRIAEALKEFAPPLNTMPPVTERHKRGESYILHGKPEASLVSLLGPFISSTLAPSITLRSAEACCKGVMSLPRKLGAFAVTSVTPACLEAVNGGPLLSLARGESKVVDELRERTNRLCNMHSNSESSTLPFAGSGSLLSIQVAFQVLETPDVKVSQGVVSVWVCFYVMCVY